MTDTKKLFDKKQTGKFNDNKNKSDALDERYDKIFVFKLCLLPAV